jgi:hypothetical protein
MRRVINTRSSIRQMKAGKALRSEAVGMPTADEGTTFKTAQLRAGGYYLRVCGK